MILSQSHCLVQGFSVIHGIGNHYFSGIFLQSKHYHVLCQEKSKNDDKIISFFGKK